MEAARRFVDLPELAFVAIGKGTFDWAPRPKATAP